MSSHTLGDRGARAPARPARATARSVPVVYWAAAVGAVLLVFELYMLVKWVVGPDFVRVPEGPSEAPGWMRTSMDVYQPLGIAATLYLFNRFLVGPWRRERIVTLYGLLCPVLLLVSVYDPAGSYFRNWYTYNAHWLNFGSALPGGLPGWQAYAEPGAMIAWPIIFIPTIYVIFFLFLMWIGAKLMGALRRRWPGMSTLVLVVATFAVIFVVDILVEGLIMMRLGWYTETGLSIINAGEYYQLPWRNVILAAVMWTGLSALGYFRNDKGQTLVERGADRFPAASAKGIGLRFLALLAAVQLILLGLYQVPMALHERSNPGHWPESISSKSYFNNHLCGFDTPRRCP